MHAGRRFGGGQREALRFLHPRVSRRRSIAVFLAM
jgi:hypothetical protein